MDLIVIVGAGEGIDRRTGFVSQIPSVQPAKLDLIVIVGNWREESGDPGWFRRFPA